MKKYLYVVIVVLVGAALWYFLSPLFLSREVNEAFPTAEMLAHNPSMMESVPPERLELMRDSIMDAAATMPDSMVSEPMMNDEMMGGDRGKPGSTTETPPAPAGPIALSSGTFTGRDSFHESSGVATLYRLVDGSFVLRLENFSVTNGPDLRVLLARGADPAHSIELADLKGNRGNQNYPIPTGTDISQYDSVIIYCKPFSVIFATAELR